MQNAIPIVAIGLLAVIGYGDMQRRRIPNALSLAIAALGLLRVIFADDAVGATHTLGVAAAIFAAAFLLFWCGAIGGGDAKLIAAMTLLIGHRDVGSFLLLMSACGGVLAVAMLARDKLRPSLEAASRQIGLPSAAASPAVSTVPYGVAIAAAGAITLMLAR